MGATANSTNAILLSRANHTGTQSADTLTDGNTNKAFLAAERTKLASIATGADVTNPEVVRDTMAAALVGGTNVTITPNDAADTITISASGSGTSDPTAVKLTGDQTIDGVKTFNAIPLLPGPATAAAHATTKAYVDSVSSGTATYKWLDAVRLDPTLGWPNNQHAMISAKITEAGVGGTLVVPKDPGNKYYYCQGTLAPLANQQWIGSGMRDPFSGVCDIRAGDGQVVPLIKPAAQVKFVRMFGLNFQGDGNPASAGLSGIDTTLGGNSWWRIADCSFYNFPEEAIKFGDSTACWFDHIFATSCLLRSSGRTALAGVIDISGGDHWISDIETGIGTNTAYVNGYRAAMYHRGTSAFIARVVAELAEVGFVLGGFLNTMTDVRADQNQAHGFLINGDENQLVALKSLTNSKSAVNTYDGMVLNGHSNEVHGFKQSVHFGSLAMRYGIHSASTSEPNNNAFANRVYNAKIKDVTSRYKKTGTTPFHIVGFRDDATYGTITPT